MLLGSIYGYLSFFYVGVLFYLYIGLTPFCCVYDTADLSFFQDGMFHKKEDLFLSKRQMDRFFLI